MKKTVGALMIAVSAIAFSANADANMETVRPYVGLDYNYLMSNAKELRPYHNATSLNVGANYSKWFGTELFYQYGWDTYTKKSDGSKFKDDTQAYGLDLMGYLPIGCDQNLSLVGTAGFGFYTIKKEFSEGGLKETNRDDGYGYRFGVGAQYDITNNFGVRALYRYINFDKIEGYDHADEFSVGVRYTF